MTRVALDPSAMAMLTAESLDVGLGRYEHVEAIVYTRYRDRLRMAWRLITQPRKHHPVYEFALVIRFDAPTIHTEDLP